MIDSGVCFGIHAVEALLQRHPARVMEVWFQSGRRSKNIEGLLGMAESLGLPVKFIDKDRLDRKADGVHQGVLALVRAATVYRENDLYDQLEQLDHPPFLLILDSVTDPHNLGAC